MESFRQGAMLIVAPLDLLTLYEVSCFFIKVVIDGGGGSALRVIFRLPLKNRSGSQVMALYTPNDFAVGCDHHY